jgi:hypothetical protein
LLRRLALLLFAVIGGLTIAKFVQHADLAVGFDQHLAAALGFCLNLFELRGELAALSGQNYLVPMGLQQSIDVGRTRRFELPTTIDRLRLLPFERVDLGVQHRLGTDSFGQLGAALVALGDAET